jgi:hypothetical protein
MKPILTVATLCVLWTAPLQDQAAAADDLFQNAVNYVFTGRIDPPQAPEIVDRQSCVVVLRDPKYDRYIRYYMSRFRMDTADFSKTYAGSQVLYDLEVDSDNVLLEYLDNEKKIVTRAYKSAHIPLLGNIEQSQKALKIIFSDYCKARKQQDPF